MTQFLYNNRELRLQTSGDCSTFTILGPEGSRELLGQIIDKLKQWQFAVDDSVRGDFIHFRAIPLDKGNKTPITYRCTKTITADFQDNTVVFTEGKLYQGLTSATPGGQWAIQFTNDLNELHLMTADQLYGHFIPASALEIMIDQSHQGDPCIYCNKPHDEVGVGPCPGRMQQRPEEQLQEKTKRTREEIQERIDDNFFEEEYD